MFKALKKLIIGYLSKAAESAAFEVILFQTLKRLSGVYLLC